MGALVGLFVVTLTAMMILAMAETPPRPQRNHIYFCMHPQSGISLPCMYRKNTPVDV